MRLRIANLSPFPWSGWLRTTTDADIAGPVVGIKPDGEQLFVVPGPRNGLDTRLIDVRCNLAPGEEVTIDVWEPTEIATPALPADPLAYFGGPLRVLGQDAQWVSLEQVGAGFRAHLRVISGLMQADVWLVYWPDQPWLEGELMVTFGDTLTTELQQTVDPVRLEFGNGVVLPVGLQPGMPLIPATTFGHGQARVVPFTIMWPNRMLPHLPEQYGSAMASWYRAISAVACERSFAGGNPTFPEGFSARMWAGQHWKRAVELLHSWDAPVLGWAADSTQTGAQEDQCFVGTETLLPDGAGAERVRYFTALKWAARPCHFYEPSGVPVDVQSRPDLRLFVSRPHRSGRDMLGKVEDLRKEQASGWMGPDAQHWFFSTLAMAARCTGSAACQRLLEHQARNYIIQLTTGSGATSAIWSSRELGWEGIAVVHLWRELADRGLADRVREHWHRRCHWLASKLPTAGPWDVRADDTRLGTGSWWMPWQQAIGAYGLDLAARILGDDGAGIRLIALRGAELVVAQAWEKAGTRWREFELVALDGRKHRSGMFWGSWLPMAVAVVLLADPANERARAIWTQIVDDCDGDGKWLPPEVKP